MVKLTPSELAKPNSKTGQPRTEILKDLVKRKQPLQLHNGSFVVVVDIDAAIQGANSFSGKPIPLIGISDGVRLEFTTSDLAKTSEFGGGAGVACGTDQTRVNESAQAVYCAATVGNSAVDKVHPNRYNIESSIDEVLSLRADWVKSSQLISDHLLAKGLIDSTQTFHHGSEYVLELCQMAKKLVEQEGITWNKDKWNPADIWAIRGEPKISWPDIHSMNRSMRQLLHDRDLIGISLKKVNCEPKHSFVNIDDQRPSFSVEKFGAVGTFGVPDFFSSKKVMVEYGEGTAHGRTYDPLKNWSLEIDGRTAKHGKIGKGPISSLLVASGHCPLPDHKFLLEGLKNAPDDFLGLFYDLYVKNPPFNDRVTEKTFFETIKTLSKTVKGMDWAYSKFIGTNFIDRIRHDKSIFTDIILYAMSQSAFSGPFVKVQEKTG